MVRRVPTHLHQAHALRRPLSRCCVTPLDFATNINGPAAAIVPRRRPGPSSGLAIAHTPTCPAPGPPTPGAPPAPRGRTRSSRGSPPPRRQQLPTHQHPQQVQAPGSSLPAAARRGYTATSSCATLPLASRNSLVRDQCTVCLNPSGGAQRAQRAHRRFGSTQFRVGCGHTAALCGSWDVGARGGRPVARGVGRQRPGRRRAGVPRRRAAGRSERHEFCLKQNIPRSAPSTVVTQGRHGGRTGRLTTVTHVL